MYTSQQLICMPTSLILLYLITQVYIIVTCIYDAYQISIDVFLFPEHIIQYMVMYAYILYSPDTHVILMWAAHRDTGDNVYMILHDSTCIITVHDIYEWNSCCLAHVYITFYTQ